jgi:hypothetical protein
MRAERISKNVHVIDCESEAEFLLISDLHWDNPHCDRELLKNHLDEAVRRNAGIIINGDAYCVMQGRADGRRNKGDIRPEHNTPYYFDAIVDTSVEWFAPYAKNILLIGYGNHETSIIKFNEIDLLQRFTSVINRECGSHIQVGGYTGVIEFRLGFGSEELRKHLSFVTHYAHGFGGGGVVTKGVLQDSRLMMAMEGYDCTWMGHVHELYHHINRVHRYDRTTKVISQRDIHQIRTATYKEEWDGGLGGFHVEKGRPPKPLGGYWMKLKMGRRVNESGNDVREIVAEFSHCTRMY